MEEMSRRNRELFKLPPYVLYVSRAFSTLEGIGLSVDPDYSILQECYPYLAKRLITDDSPRARAALTAMLYGPQPSPPVDHGALNGGAIIDVVGAPVGAPLGNKVATTTVRRRSSNINGLLSPTKVAEMADGFTSYTSFTVDADNAGKGMAGARAAIADILLQNGTQTNLVQEV